MGVQHIKMGPVAVEAGKVYRIAIPAPAKGEVVRAQCVQVGGTSTFAFTLYNSLKSCPPDPLVGGVPTPPVPALVIDPLVEYEGQIGPTRSVTSKDRYVDGTGADAGWTSYGSYVNADGGHSNAQGKIYLKFAPVAAGNFIFFFTIKTSAG